MYAAYNTDDDKWVVARDENYLRIFLSEDACWIWMETQHFPERIRAKKVSLSLVLKQDSVGKI